jgi:thiol-disulfide isomerase/thioredoxin
VRSAWIVVGLLVLGLGCSVELPAPKGEPAPAFELEMLSGGTISLEDLRGKTVLIDFWATWCPPCVREIPELNAFYSVHRANGVEILAISVDIEEREFLEDWTAEKGVLYPVAIGDVDLALTYGAEQFPYHLLVGPDGRILERLYPGYHDREELRELVARHEKGQREG